MMNLPLVHAEKVPVQDESTRPARRSALAWSIDSPVTELA